MTETATLSPDEILQEVQTLSSQPQPEKSTSFILKNLLNEIQPIDFEGEVYGDSTDGEKKLFQKHYIIITIERMLEVARSNDWSLCHLHSYYYVYNGEFWNVIEEAELKTFLGKVAEKMGVPKFDSRHYEFKDKLFKQFETTAQLPQPENSDDTILINLFNGTFEITPDGQRLRAFSPDDFLTHQLPFKFDPEATAPTFQKYIDEVLPDEESQRVLSEFLGYIFTRNLKLERVLFLFGSGRNGKSVMFDIIKAMLGTENVSHYGLANLTDESGYYRAKLVNKLINWASDVGDRLQSNTFKQLASGEPIECRLPYREPFQLENVCKFAFNTNTLPTDVEHTSAFFERFLIIPFDQYIEPERRDPKLANKIISNEMPGVFNWVIDGLNRLVSQGRFSRCKASEQVLANFRKDSDSVAQFIEEMNYKATTEEWTQAKPVYGDYRDFCYGEGLRPLARKNFHKRLESLGFFTTTMNVGKVIYMRKYQTNGQSYSDKF